MVRRVEARLCGVESRGSHGANEEPYRLWGDHGLASAVITAHPASAAITAHPASAAIIAHPACPSVLTWVLTWFAAPEDAT